MFKTSHWLLLVSANL